MMMSHSNCQSSASPLLSKSMMVVFLVSKHTFAVTEEEPSGQSMLIMNSFVVMSIYLSQNKLGLFVAASGTFLSPT